LYLFRTDKSIGQDDKIRLDSVGFLCFFARKSKQGRKTDAKARAGAGWIAL
jgi:hypothetical protein